MRRRIAPASLVLLLAWAGAPAAAGWRADGTPVALVPGAQSAAQVIADGAGGVYVAWQDRRSGNSWIYVQRLTAAGTLAPGWPENGVGTFGGYDPTIALDPRGGVLVGITQYERLHLGRVSSEGRFIAGAQTAVEADAHVSATGPDRGRIASPADALKYPAYTSPLLAPAPDGGMILAWSRVGLTGETALVLRYGPDMQLAPDWPGPAAVELGGGTKLAPVACSGDSGDVFVAWVGWGAVSASRLTRDGRIAPGWPRHLEGLTEYGTEVGVGILPDGAGGAIVIWQRPEHGVRAQRLMPSGEVAAGWPESWRLLSRFPGEPGIVRYPSSHRVPHVHHCAVAPDGAGGAYVTWSDRRADPGDIYLQRVRGDGTLAAGWPADGVGVCVAPGAQRAPSLAADGAGGVFLAWQDGRDGAETDIYAARVGADGRLVPGWPSGGLALCAQGGDQQLPRLAADGAGGAIIAWQDGRCADLDLFASRVGPEGAAPAGTPFPGVTAVLESAGFSAEAVDLTWQVSAGADPVEVQRLGPEDMEWATAAQLAPDAVGRVDFAETGLFAGCRYRYGLRLAGCSRYGETTLTVPDAEGFLRIAATTATAVLNECAPLLTWTLSPGPLEAVRLYRRSGTAEWTSLGELIPDSTRTVRYRDTGTATGTAYGYRLGLTSCAIERPAGETWIAVPLPDSALAARVTAVAFDSGAAVVTWQVRSPSDSAEVQRIGPDEPWTTIRRVALAGSDSVRVVDREVFAGCAYRYRLGLVPCWGSVWSDEVPVAVPAEGPFRLVQAQVITATTSSGVPVVRWQLGPGPLERVRVERRTALGDWGVVLEPAIGSSRLVAYQDLDAEPGVRYGYRLEITSCGHARRSLDTWLGLEAVTPQGPPLALEPPRPNPTRGALHVAFSLPDASPAWLQLHDALGRLVRRVEVGSLGPGRHQVSLERGPGLPAGLYWLRLVQGNETRQVTASLLD